MASKKTAKKPQRWMKNASSVGDAQLKEFEAKDLGDDLVASGAMVRIRPQQPTSILLPAELKAVLKRRGEEMGVGYQTLAKMILTKYANAKL